MKKFLNQCSYTYIFAILEFIMFTITYFLLQSNKDISYEVKTIARLVFWGISACVMLVTSVHNRLVELLDKD